tara:strand:- start:410 stop:1057 length:648 start_codon:yes stop_codon:yes gene_type:complete
MIGEHFVNKCLSTDTGMEPWPYQEIEDSFPEDFFAKFNESCHHLLDFDGFRTGDKKNTSYDGPVPFHVYPKDFDKFNINLYNEVEDIAKTILPKAKDLCMKINPRHRWFSKLGVNAHISITPPLPYKFHIHQETGDKIWSAVTYVTPEKNVGTKMYTREKAESFVKEAKWKPNSTFIFCGENGKTWHSYESDQASNRITFNLFIMKPNKYTFYHG